MRLPTILNSILEVEYVRLWWSKLWSIDPLLSVCLGPARVEAISARAWLIKRDVFEQVGTTSCTPKIWTCATSLSARDLTAVNTKGERRFCDKSYGVPMGLYSGLRWRSILSPLALIAAWPCFRAGVRERGRLDSASLRWRSC